MGTSGPRLEREREPSCFFVFAACTDTPTDTDTHTHRRTLQNNGDGEQSLAALLADPHGLASHPPSPRPRPSAPGSHASYVPALCPGVHAQSTSRCLPNTARHGHHLVGSDALLLLLLPPAAPPVFLSLEHLSTRNPRKTVATVVARVSISRRRRSFATRPTPYAGKPPGPTAARRFMPPTGGLNFFGGSAAAAATRHSPSSRPCAPRRVLPNVSLAQAVLRARRTARTRLV